VVSLDEYESYLQELEAKGYVAEEPLLGGSDARTQAGLEEAENETHGGTE
jgi:cytochrome c oxidase subunit 2